MLINILLILSSLAIIGSWVVAVRLLQSDKFSDTKGGQAPATTNRRVDVLANTTL